MKIEFQSRHNSCNLWRWSAACVSRPEHNFNSGRAAPSPLDRAARKLLASASAEQPADPRAAADATNYHAAALNRRHDAAHSNDAVIKELAEMKARIALLEAELKAKRRCAGSAERRQRVAPAHGQQQYNR